MEFETSLDYNKASIVVLAFKRLMAMVLLVLWTDVHRIVGYHNLKREEARSCFKFFNIVHKK